MKVGNPTWNVTDIHLFTAPAEPFTPVAREHRQRDPAPHFSIVNGVVVPTPHPGPYTNQLLIGLANQGISDRSVFSPQNLARNSPRHLAGLHVGARPR